MWRCWKKGREGGPEVTAWSGLVYGLGTSTLDNVCTSSQKNKRSTLIWIHPLQSQCVHHLLLLEHAPENINLYSQKLVKYSFQPQTALSLRELPTANMEFLLLSHFHSCSTAPYRLGVRASAYLAITNLIMALEPAQCPQGSITWLIQEALFS